MATVTVEQCARIALEWWRSGSRTLTRLDEIVTHQATSCALDSSAVWNAARAQVAEWEVVR